MPLLQKDAPRLPTGRSGFQPRILVKTSFAARCRSYKKPPRLPTGRRLPAANPRQDLFRGKMPLLQKDALRLPTGRSGFQPRILVKTSFAARCRSYKKTLSDSRPVGAASSRESLLRPLSRQGAAPAKKRPLTPDRLVRHPAANPRQDLFRGKMPLLQKDAP